MSIVKGFERKLRNLFVAFVFLKQVENIEIIVGVVRFHINLSFATS